MARRTAQFSYCIKKLNHQPISTNSFKERIIMQTTSTHTSANISANTLDAGKLVLRAVLAAMLLFHGIAKMHNGVGFVADMLAKAGLPAVFGYGVYIGEVIAPLFILLGLFTRPAALVVAINMIVAVLLVHTGQLFTLNETGGWALELQGMFLFTALAIALLGAGRYSVGGLNGRFN
jgi:putative oxidoreductase